LIGGVGSRSYMSLWEKPGRDLGFQPAVGQRDSSATVRNPWQGCSSKHGGRRSPHRRRRHRGPGRAAHHQRANRRRHRLRPGQEARARAPGAHGGWGRVRWRAAGALLGRCWGVLLVARCRWRAAGAVAACGWPGCASSGFRRQEHTVGYVWGLNIGGGGCLLKASQHERGRLRRHVVGQVCWDVLCSADAQLA
jgi:hypothetical protein